jgi:DNA-binding transcriptional MerR regulator
LVLKIIKRLLDAGVSLQNIRVAVEHLRGRGVVDLERITLMSDGVSIYECASSDEIIDLLAGGQGVFGIAVGKVWNEVEGSLATITGEVEGLAEGGEGNDELSQRRRAKGA